jgi:hypothetical protein
VELADSFAVLELRELRVEEFVEGVRSNSSIFSMAGDSRGSGHGLCRKYILLSIESYIS